MKLGLIREPRTAYTDHDAVVMSDEEVISAYSAVTGYRPSDPSTDRGGLISDALRFWRMSGMPTPDGGPDVLTGAALTKAKAEGLPYTNTAEYQADPNWSISTARQ
jgi:hypothetical protein